MGRDVQHDKDRGRQVGRQAGNQQRNGRHAAGGGADDNDIMPAYTLLYFTTMLFFTSVTPSMVPAT